MQDYINRILKYREKFKVITLNYNDIDSIKEVVLKSLNLTNINQLRDKYEGVSFYQNFSNRISGVIALEKFLSINLIDWDNLTAKNYKPSLSVNDKEVDVITASDRDFPVINALSVNPAIIVLRPQEKSLWICGYATKEVLNSNQNENLLKGLLSNKTNETAFTGFDKLCSFESFEDLQNLVN